jgi:hypothetical protein
MEVRFESGPEGLWVRPIGGAVLDLPLRGVAAWPDLRAAAGHALSDAESLAPERVMLPITQEGADLFAVRVAGRSMDGGKTPMHDGDWAVMRVARGAPLAQVDGRVVLVQAPGAGAGHTWQIKRLKQRDSGWWFTSDNPDGPSFPANEDTTIVARLEAVVRPEDLAPAPGTVLSNEAFAERFGLERAPVSSGVAGAHRFRFLGANDLSAPDRLADPIAAAPGETAYVLRPDGTGGWRYLGVARPTGDAWTLPEVDYATWRACGAGREVSRPTPAHALVEARALVERLLERGLTRLSQRGGNSAPILGRASHGGLRVATGDGEGSRTISLTDLAWVRVAADDVAERGGLLDEARVNHHRYLAGTPAGSTRFIDTGWAIAAWQLDSENAVP